MTFWKGNQFVISQHGCIFITRPQRPLIIKEHSNAKQCYLRSVNYCSERWCVLGLLPFFLCYLNQLKGVFHRNVLHRSQGESRQPWSMKSTEVNRLQEGKLLASLLKILFDTIHFPKIAPPLNINERGCLLKPSFPKVIPWETII